MAKNTDDLSIDSDEMSNSTDREANDGGFGERLSQAIEARGDRLAGAARKMGVSKQTLDQWVKGRSVPRADVAFEICQRYGMDLEYLLSGKISFVSASADLVMLPHFPTQPSAGGGALAPLDQASDGDVAFSAAWLRLIGVNPRRAHVLTAKGDSMEPTIRDGDLLILDRSIDHVVDAGIYVVTVGGMVVVKRVQVSRDGTLILRSDNGRYHDEVIPADELYTIKVEGRVCWSGRPM